MEDYSINTIMDEINVRTVNLLKGLIKSTKSVKNFRVVNHEIKVKFGDFDVADSRELMQMVKNKTQLLFKFLIYQWHYPKKLTRVLLMVQSQMKKSYH